VATPASPLALLSNPTFRMLWTGNLVSNLGGLIQTVGAAWMMTTIATSNLQVALVQASNTLPIMLFALAAGALADAYDRRRIMLFAQGFMFVVSLALTLAAWFDMLTPWTLLMFTFLIGCGTALNIPSWQSSMGDIVSKPDLPSAVLLNSMGFNMTRSVGPAIGGVIVSFAGAAFAFAANTASYFLLIFALWRWKGQGTVNALPREPFGQAIAAGIRYVAMSPNLLNVLGRGFLFGIAAVSVLALLPLVARNLLQGTSIVFGLLLGCYGVGAIVGALVSVQLRTRFNNEVIVRASFAAFGVVVLILGYSRSIVLDCVALFAAGAGWVLALSLFNVTIQLSTPRWVVGRAMAIYQSVTFGGMALGSWLWGVIAESHGADEALILSALLLAVGGLVGLRMPVPEFGTIDFDPADSFSEPQLRLELKTRSGPIMVMVDYEIDQKDVPAFLAAMADRRRIRIRDGARQWALLRDLENPDIWTETYHVATWIEYVRHNQRRTKGDAEVTERLRKLHKGTSPIRVHRMIERQTVPLTDDMPVKNHPEVH
jgi:Arabinose efflux permease